MPALRLLRSLMSLAMAACLAFAGVTAWMGITRTPAEAASDGLTIWVGYAQGPYYQKAHFTDAQLRALSDGITYEYSALDSASFLRKGFAKGVPLQRLMSAAGVDEGAIWRFYLGTTDGYVDDKGDYGTNGEAWYYRNLVNTPRYYYSALCANAQFVGSSFNGIYPEGESAVLQSAVPVPSMLAFESAFSRVGRFDDPAWDSQPLSSQDGYRLMFGQANPTEVTARDSAMAVKSITCILGGSDGTDVPVVDLGDELAEAIKNANVGDVLTFAPGLSNVMDAVVAEQGWRDIQLSCDETDVLEVRQNADYTWSIIIKGKGEATLKCSFGNGGDAFSYHGSAALQCGYGNGTGSGEGEGDGNGTGAGDANGDGDGEGDAGNADGAAASADGDAQTVTFGEDVSLHAATLAPQAVAETAGSEGGSSGDGDLEAAADLQTYQLIVDDAAPLSEEPQLPSGTGFFGALSLCLMFGGVRKAASFQLAKDGDPAEDAGKDGEA